VYVYTLNFFLTYDDSGQLLCILCESIVRSEAVWNTHINSKKHRENIAHVKRKREDALNCVPPSVPLPVKRPAQTEVILPTKKPKG
jgi:zinc finger protein 830